MQAELTRSSETFQSEKKKIRVETFSRFDHRDAPSIIVLHGATGLEDASRFIATLAQSIAAQGFAVHLVHYFDRTGAHYADDETIKRSSLDWLKTVNDAVGFVRKSRPHAAIGLFGYSLGGFLAAAVTVRNPHVGAAVILSGGLDESSLEVARYAPPVLILHGAEDRRVPVSEARRLEATLTRLGRPPRVHIYPHERHIMGLAAYGDVLLRSVAFLRENLCAESG